MNDYILNNDYKDLNGNRIKRTPISYPYNYDTFVQWSNNYNKGKSHSVYSDRMFSWNSKKFDECCMKIWGNTGQCFYDRTPEKINEFLNLYLDKEVILTAILQGCNQSTGYSYWCFIYENKE